MADADVIIIGSGPAGVHAALPLVQAGVRVLMIDGGKEGSALLETAPALRFDEMRRTRNDQWKWFLGGDFSGIPIRGLEGGLGGGMVSGNRRYVIDGTSKSLPLHLENAQVIQSLAKGGLGAAWGATSAFLSAENLRAMGLPPEEMEKHYDAISVEIGISGLQGRTNIQPALKLDHHARRFLDRSKRKKEWFTEHHLNLIQPHAAVLTEDLKDRKKQSYRDMDYWSDPERSVYRPHHTLEKLITHKNFTYLPSRIVTHIQENANEVSVHSQNLESMEKETIHSAKKVICCAGTVNTARILLKSFALYDVPISFVGKPHVFSAMLHTSMIGNPGDIDRFSLCQMLLIDEEKRHGMGAGCAQLYSYRSLQLFRLLSALPLPVPMALRLASMLAPALVIADIRFPAFPHAANTLKLTQNGVHIQMSVTEDEKSLREKSLKRIHAGLKKLGLMNLKTLTLPEASSSHYAGTVPTEKESHLPLSVDENGKLHRSQSIFVADGSVFRSLSPLPHTLTIMANARRVADGVLTSLS